MTDRVIPSSTENLSNHAAEIPKGDTANFEERWSAWQARGAAHDQVIRQRMMFALLTLAIIAAVLYVVLFR